MAAHAESMELYRGLHRNCLHNELTADRNLSDTPYQQWTVISVASMRGAAPEQLLGVLRKAGIASLCAEKNEKKKFKKNTRSPVILPEGGAVQH